MSLEHSLSSVGFGLPRESIDDIIHEGVRTALAHEEILARIVEAERERRRLRSFQRRLSRSRLGTATPLADFDFQHPSRIDRGLIEQAFSLRFVNEGGAVLLVAPTGLGKTHIARALVQAALVGGRRALFVDAMDALDQLVAARAAGRLASALRPLLRTELLCLDGIAYQRTDLERLDLLFEVVRKRYDNHRAVVITTSLPFAQWPSVMPSTAATAALVDRLVHRGLLITIEGDSYRRRQALERAAPPR
jgi:DNA replication protein DnaC